VALGILFEMPMNLAFYETTRKKVVCFRFFVHKNERKKSWREGMFFVSTQSTRHCSTQDREKIWMHHLTLTQKF